MKIGIYGLRNKLNNKWYVGQSNDIEKRWNEYRLFRCKSQPKLYHALQKYGYEAFECNVIEECDVKLLSEREEYWVKEKNSVKDGYNCKSGGFMGGKHSEETKEKIRKTMMGRKASPESIAKRKLYRPTDTTKAKISKALIGNQYRKGIPTSDAEKARLSEFFSTIPRTEEWRANIAKSATWKGKVSPDARKRAADKLRGKTRSDDVRSKISDTKKGTKRVYHPNGSFTMEKPQELQ